ncbi:MAG: hypothetical protein SWN98_11505, partial [Pseudomonadota bacterium]|nr:hypothetical protein [Pseudomonadota bacterium]
MNTSARLDKCCPLSGIKKFVTCDFMFMLMPADADEKTGRRLNSGRLTGVHKPSSQNDFYARITVPTNPSVIASKIIKLKGYIRPDLSLSDLSGSIDSGLSGPIGLSSEEERPNQKHSTYGDSAERPPRGPIHALSSFIHRLRGSVHALLGDKIIFLALGSLGFSALAGFGGYRIFDDPDRN